MKTRAGKLADIKSVKRYGPPRGVRLCERCFDLSSSNTPLAQGLWTLEYYGDAGSDIFALCDSCVDEITEAAKVSDPDDPADEGFMRDISQ